MGKHQSGEVGQQGSGEVWRQGSGEAGKTSLSIEVPWGLQCKDDGCLSEGNHKSLSLPQAQSVARAKDMPFGNVQREKQQTE